MRFTLRHLEVFAAIATLENVSAAADTLGMSQSAASTALAELERRSGRPLFERAGKRLRLNETGRKLLPYALEMIDRAGEIERLLEGRSGPGPLRLGATAGHRLDRVEHCEGMLGLDRGTGGDGRHRDEP